jgi:carbon monoxide dehydrogenase subunit G
VQLEHSFTVPVGIDDAWRVLVDIEAIAPCMPGAAIDSVDGDDFTGTVKVKLGPIGLTYKGKASFIEKDEAAHRAVIDARGRDSRGNGTANAKVTATLTESSGSTRVDVLTDLDITGKPAQFGRGVMADVGNKLIGQFADCLAGKLTDGATPAAAQAAPTEPPKLTTVAADDSKPKPRTRAGKTPASSASTGAAAKATKSAKATARNQDKAPAKTAKAPAKSSAKAAAKAPAKPTAKATAAAAAAPGVTNATVPPPEVSSAPKPDTAPPPAAEEAASSAGTAAPTTASPRPVAADVEPIDLIHSAGPAVLKRLLPVIVVVIFALLALRRRRHR